MGRRQIIGYQHHIFTRISKNNNRYEKIGQLWPIVLQLQTPKGRIKLYKTCGRGKPHQFYRQYQYKNIIYITTSNTLFKSTISTKGARFLCCDIKILTRYTNGQIQMHPIIAEILPIRNHSKIWPKGDITQWIHLCIDKVRRL